MASLRFLWVRRMATVAVGIALISLVWNYSARVPVFRQSNSRWAPLAFSTDGQIIAVADLTGTQQNWLLHEPGGPIHLLRAADLSSVAAPIETPAVGPAGTTYFPPLNIVEFSPNGDLLAVAQPNRDEQQLDTLELHLIRLPAGDVWKTIPIPYDRFRKKGGIARRLFSSDGRVLAWHELSQEADHFNGVRVWGVAEERERFAIDGVTYPVLSPNANLLAVLEPYNIGGIACRLYDTRDGQLLHSLPLSGNDAGWQPWPEFSSDGQHVAVNTRSSTGKGPSVRVFDVASGLTVFEAPEWSPYFVAGPMLMTVKDDSVIFRETKTWRDVTRVSFSIGKHWENGNPISPEPVPVPNSSTALVYNYYPSWFFIIGRLTRVFDLDFNLGHCASCIDGKSGVVSKFTADDLLAMRTVSSSTGGKVAIQGASGITIWKMPPRRSWIPVSVIAGVLALFYGRRALARRRMVTQTAVDSADQDKNAIP